MRCTYCAWPETALLAKCEDRVCQGTVAEKNAILTDVEYRWIVGLLIAVGTSVIASTLKGFFLVDDYRK